MRRSFSGEHSEHRVENTLFLACRYFDASQRAIWITEYGTDDTSVQDEFPAHAFDSLNRWATVAPSNNAVAALKTAESAAKSGAFVIGPVIWFCWSDGMVESYGVVTAGGEAKASYESYQRWSREHPLELGL